MRRRAVLLLALVFELAGAVACGDENDAVTTPTPDRPTTTETFTGTLTVNGAATHPFVATGSGQITLTLTTLSPDAAARIGVSLGTFNGTACQIVITNDNATQGATVIGVAGASGNFCARVQDVGRLTEPTDYTLTIVHF
jgi:hypothetical protein